MNLIAGLIHALPVHERRVFNRDEAASYVGVSPGHFKKLVDDGVMPAPLSAFGRVCRWDKAAPDEAVYAVSGAGGWAKEAPGAYDQWRNARGQG